MSDIVQGSPEWFAIRLGKATASRMADITARTKSGYSTSRANYAAQLIAERLTGEPNESYQNAAMKWGIDTEPHARAAYEWANDVTVMEVGFVPHPKIAMAGCSPDGRVGDNGLVEIKCPQTAAHLETLLGREVPTKYIAQMQFQMACDARQWCDFVSFDPRMPESMRLFVRRIERDDKFIMQLEHEVHTFLEEVDETVRQLRARYEARRQAA